MNSQELVFKIATDNPKILSFRLIFFSPSPSVQQRTAGKLSATEKDLLARATEARAHSGRTFIESMLDQCTASGSSSRAFFDAAIYHQPNTEVIDVPVTELRSTLLELEKRTFAINSRVATNNGFLHIPLLDFKIRESPTSLKIVIECLETLGLTGHVITSGKSYHFFGDDFIEEQALIELLAKFSMLHPISDRLWSAHQIIERSASLRISERNGLLPQVVCRIC